MNDIDILSIHSDILQIFTNNKKNLQLYIDELQYLKKTCENVNLSNKIKNDLNFKIKNLQNYINDIQTNKSENYYTMETAEILNQYQDEIKKSFKVSFIGKTNMDNDVKNNIISKYINIALTYNPNIDIKLPEKKSQKIKCKNCNNSKNFDINDNSYICIECGSVISFVNNQSSYKDNERVNISQKYTYDRKIHFRDCINQFQGKQNSTISDKIYNSLIKQFELHSLLVNSEDKKIRFKNITKEHIYLFLKETDNTKHYEDTVLIYCKITGKKAPNISLLEPKLLEDFDTLANLYDEKCKKDPKFFQKIGTERKNFINTQYVLYQLLKRHKYKCRRTDFNILKTMDRQSYHDDICKELFEELNWNFSALF